jgi:hypothetical protein
MDAWLEGGWVGGIGGGERRLDLHLALHRRSLVRNRYVHHHGPYK